MADKCGPARNGAEHCKETTPESLGVDWDRIKSESGRVKRKSVDARLLEEMEGNLSDIMSSDELAKAIEEEVQRRNVQFQP